MNNKILSFTSKHVQLLKKTPLYNGFFRMVRYDFRHRLFSGGWSDVISREIFERGHAVAVLPYDRATGEFVLVEQIRIGALSTTDTPWLLEIIAGIIDEGETETSVCHREASEEAGIQLTHLTKAVSYLTSPGGTTERIHIYIAATDASAAHGVHGLAHEGEDILVHRIAESQALEWLENGRINNAAAIIALQWFFMHKQKLLEKWHQSV